MGRRPGAYEGGTEEDGLRQGRMRETRNQRSEMLQGTDLMMTTVTKTRGGRLYSGGNSSNEEREKEN